MASVLLSVAAGTAASAAAGPLGLTALSGTVLGVSASTLATGAFVGAAQAVGGFVGSQIDRALFGPSSPTIRGAQLGAIQPLSSEEGTPLPVVYGQCKVTGKPNWSTNYRRVTSTRKVKQGGSGGGSQRVEENTYYRSWSIKLARRAPGATRAIDGIGRVWANGQVVDISEWTTRLYLGEESQEPDPLIVATEGYAPAWKRDAYLVIEELELTEFGNRPPVLEVEVYRAVTRAGTAPDLIRAIQIIPSSDEFGYDPLPVQDVAAAGSAVAVNRRGGRGASDWEASIDRLEMVAPNIEQASLVVSWFGDDLRVGECTIRPKVDSFEKDTRPYQWSVNGIVRSAASRVSLIEGRPAFGGTPSDVAVVRALQDIKARGLRASLLPFILMDIPAGNELPDPYSPPADPEAEPPVPATFQPVYPWRGRITSAANGTAGVTAEIATFFGSAEASDFAIQSDGRVLYSGPAEFSFRRFIFHHAMLAKAAGGVDLFVIGNELRGITWLRDNTGAYPAVARLVDLLADVAAIGGVATRITYGADWSEFAAHQDGTDLTFHLDPIWSHASCSGPALSAYWPLSDWRETADHLDAATAWSIRDPAYLVSNIEGGEGFDWFYASDNDRASQTRTPITDGAYDEPWVFRYKDLRSWWSNAHHNRAAGIRSGTATAWTPFSKPITLFEVGCPAIDKGSNQPNVFADPKSSESFLPYFSTGARDDDIQRRYLEAMLGYWSNPSNNPVVSTVPLFDMARAHVWCWDARPYPEFPARRDVWGDFANYRIGHWLPGRLGKIEIAAILAEIAAKHGWALDAERCVGLIDGALRDGPGSDREFLQPLLELVQADVHLAAGTLIASSRAYAPTIPLDAERLVPNARGEQPIETVDADDLDIPRRVRLQYYEGGTDYRRAVAEPMQWTGEGGDAVLDAAAPVVMPAEEAEARASSLMSARRAARKTDAFRAPPSALALRPGSAISVAHEGGVIETRALAASWEWAREIAAERLDRTAFLPGAGLPDGEATQLAPSAPAAAPVLIALDLPRLDAIYVEHAPYFAAYARPWVGVDVWRGLADDLERDAVITAPSVIGALSEPLAAGVVNRWDDASTLTVVFVEGGIASVTDRAALDGDATLAVEHASGEWEVISWVNAELIAPRTYRLTRLLRGLLGTEPWRGASAGARVVILTGALEQPGYGVEQRAQAWDYRFGPATQNVASTAYTPFSAAYRGVGLRPFTPAHARVAAAGADLVATWVRRARWGGDDWEPEEIAAPDPRRYRVRWKASGGAVLLTQTITDAETATITAGQGAASAATVEITHIGERWGEGPAAIVEI